MPIQIVLEKNSFKIRRQAQVEPALGQSDRMLNRAHDVLVRQALFSWRAVLFLAQRRLA